MGANLSTLTRLVNLSGLSGNPGDLDPLWFPVEGAGLSTLTHGDQGGQPGFTIDGGSSAEAWMMTAVPLAAFHDDASATATQVTIEWEQDVSDELQFSGGPMFYHYSGDHYGSDGAGYFFRLSVQGAGVNKGRLFTRPNDESSFTQVGSDFTFTIATWARFRATLALGTGSLKTLTLEQHTGGSWTTVQTFADTADMGSMFGVAWRSVSNMDLKVRGPDGAMGPVVTFRGPSFVGVVSGQSEFSGRSPGFQANVEEDIYHVNRQGQFVSPMTDPWSGAQAAHGTWTGISAENAVPGGSFGVELARRIRPMFPTQCWNVLSPKGGLAAADYSPPAAAVRYDTTTRGGARDLMTTILAGDGRTPGQRLVHFYWQGTRDAVLATSEAAYKADVQAVFDRIHALFPTSGCYLAVVGDRTYASSGAVTAGESQAIRNAQQQLILEGVARLWFDDEQLVGPIGTGTGWNNPGDELHPGDNDNAILGVLADEAFLDKQYVVGGLDGVLLRPTQSFDNTGQQTEQPARLSDVDGVADASYREALLAYVSGVSTVTDNADGTKTITYKKQDGATDKLTITFNSAGEFITTSVV